MSLNTLNMQASSQPRWEYLVIMTITCRAGDTSLTIYNCKNKEIQKALNEHSSIDSALSSLGALGWELVAAAPGWEEEYAHLYFKRRCV